VLTESEQMADTQMQQNVREKHGKAMGDIHRRFAQLKETGQLLRPEQPGHVIAELSLRARKEHSGEFLRYVSCPLLKGSSTDWEIAGTRNNWLPSKNDSN
jgi:hypothetical protein